MGKKVKCEVSINGGKFVRYESFHQAERVTGFSAAYLARICDKEFKFRKSGCNNVIVRKVQDV